MSLKWVRAPAAPTRPTTVPLAEVTVDVSREWTDTYVPVRAGDRLVFWSTGTILDVRRPERQADPDGITPTAESVGPGGSSAAWERPSRRHRGADASDLEGGVSVMETCPAAPD